MPGFLGAFRLLIFVTMLSYGLPIVACGLKLALAGSTATTLLYASGTLPFFIAPRGQGKPMFTRVEWILFGSVVAVAAGAPVALASGCISV